MKLAEFQARFADALLGRSDDRMAGWLCEDSFAAEALLDIYRDSVFASLTSTLGDTFPLTSRVLGEKAFRSVAKAFIRTFPPRQPRLDEYGDSFGEFLAVHDGFQEQPHLQHLPDLARLEWLVNRAAHAAESSPVPASAYRRVARVDPGDLTFILDASIGWIDSRFPVDVIWSAGPGERPIENRPHDRPDICIEVRRRAGRVVLRRLDPAVHSFRVAIGGAEALASAGKAASLLQPDFSVPAALYELFRSSSIASFSILGERTPE